MQVAQHLLGCSQSLHAVTEHVISIYSENGQDDNLTKTAVRNIIIDLAARKSFAAKDGESLMTTATVSAHHSFDSHSKDAAPCSLFFASAEKQQQLESAEVTRGRILCFVSRHPETAYDNTVLCAVAKASMDALDDNTLDCMWQWELRDLKAIPKALKPAAKDHKKLMHKVCSLLM